MKTLKEIQELYLQTGIRSLRDVELLQLLGINLESCDFLELFKSTREALLRKGFTAPTAAKITALGEVANRCSSTPIPVSIGGVSATVVDVKIIVKRALELLASSIVLIHNNPSGNDKPGENDKVQTKLLKDANNLLLLFCPFSDECLIVNSLL
jgi:hypothetical protein